MREVYVLGPCRTAIGTFGGSLKDVSAIELGVIVMKESMKRAGIKPEQIEEVMFGNVVGAGLGQNMARQCSIHAGIPKEVSAMTVNLVCGSGMKSLVEGARSIKCGDHDIVMVGGSENMSAAPYYLPSGRWGQRMNDGKIIDGFVKDGLWEAFNNYHMGITAENVAEQWHVSREEQDRYSAQSQQRLAAANASGRMADEIVPVMVKKKKETIEFKVDEHGKPGTTAEGLAKLKPAFKKDGGTVTAGNASGINDGAAAMILVSGEKVKELGLKPVAKLIGYGQAGVDPSIMGVGPIGASQAALKASGWEVKDLDLIEANEAFASQTLAVGKTLGFNEEILNVNGGAISMGHPIGCSGARIIVTLLGEMVRRKKEGKKCEKGLATLCIGGGMGIASTWELV
ncbi:MAG TPA: acetyl-CoA C-acetyltransferase [Oscillospiraceae bacterium]|nr:acetyl-CoA C-acetyltransferase [Oscillospiraceae bacterium]